MQLSHLLIGLLAAAGVARTAAGQAPRISAANQVSLCVTTAIGSCGTLCEPFACQPNYTLVTSYETMYFDITGAPFTFYVLVAGDAAPGCLPIPGIEGALAVWTPAMTVQFGLFDQYSNGTGMDCDPSHVQTQLPVPFVLPGYDMRFQVLGLDSYARDEQVLSFSRPTEVRTR